MRLIALVRNPAGIARYLGTADELTEGGRAHPDRARLVASRGRPLLQPGADRVLRRRAHHPGIAPKWAQFGISGDPRIAKAWRGWTIPDDPRVLPNERVFISLRDNRETHDREPFVPFGRVISGMDVVDAGYAEYGENAGSGIRSGKQGPIFEGGNAHLDHEFPKLDRIRRALVIER